MSPANVFDRARTLAAGVVCAALASACASSPPTTFLTLTAVPPGGGASSSSSGAGATSGQGSIGVGKVTLPVVLDRSQLVRRSGDHELEIEGLVRWAAPLDSLVRETLAFDLAARLPPDRVVLPGAGGADPGRWVVVSFERLSPGPDAEVELIAHWSLVDAESRRAVLVRSTSLTIDAGAGTGSEVAAAISEGLGRLADEIVDALGDGHPQDGH